MILKAESISHGFNDRQMLFDNLNLSVDIGDYVCVVGKSGCGKSTLLNIIAGMHAPVSGTVFVDGIDIYSTLTERKRTALRNSKIGYLNYGNCLLENLTVFDNIIYPVLLKGSRCNKDEVMNILEALDISVIKDLYPWQISAGEYRRVCFGRILALNTEILILDEPTSNLDEKSADIIVNMIFSLRKNKGIIVATHDKMLMSETIIAL